MPDQSRGRWALVVGRRRRTSWRFVALSVLYFLAVLALVVVDAQQAVFSETGQGYVLAGVLTVPAVCLAAVQAFENEGYAVSWIAGFAPAFAVGLNLVGVGFVGGAAPGPGIRLGIGLVYGSLGGFTLGSVGFLLGIAGRYLLTGRARRTRST